MGENTNTFNSVDIPMSPPADDSNGDAMSVDENNVKESQNLQQNKVIDKSNSNSNSNDMNVDDVQSSDDQEVTAQETKNIKQKNASDSVNGHSPITDTNEIQIEEASQTTVTEMPDFNALPVTMLYQLVNNIRSKYPDIAKKIIKIESQINTNSNINSDSDLNQTQTEQGLTSSKRQRTSASPTNAQIDNEALERDAAAQQYGDGGTNTGSGATSSSTAQTDAYLRSVDAQQIAMQAVTATTSDAATTFVDKAKFVPIRLSYNERPYLRLLEGATLCSTYTDKVDGILPNGNQRLENKRITLQCKLMCAMFTGLLTANDYEAGKRVMIEKNFHKHEGFFKAVFEIGRRYKILNPERLREAYGKMVYVLQDSNMPALQELLGFSCIEPVRSVWDILQLHKSGRELLSDPMLHVATSEIFSTGKHRREVDRELRIKEEAKRTLRRKYATQQRNHGHHLRGNYFYRFDVQGDDQSTIGYRPNEEMLDEDHVETCIASLGDHNTYLRFNRDSSEKLIQYLRKYFSPSEVDEKDPTFNLTISEGKDGARLSHSHERQFHFVLQSLLLWREVLAHMFQLWHYAEKDLLDPQTPYELTQTGQGYQRVQPCKRVHSAMIQILERVQKQVGIWIGSAQIHLGDRNVPNALIFIDKYTQVPRICGPVALCLEKIPELYQSSPLSRRFIDNGFGGIEKLQKRILSDFFRHAFDGSGGDNFFDAGSCVDGRLTSAWNWCSQIETKDYFPIFLLSGFTGFDGKEGWD